MSPHIQVFVVDSHDLVRAGLKRILAETGDIQCVGEASSIEEAIKILPELKPDILLMDIKIPCVNAEEATGGILKQFPQIKVLVVGARLNELLLDKLFYEGVYGYITKSSSKEEMLKAIRTLYNGARYLNPEFAQKIALLPDFTKEQDKKNITTFDSLSEREFQVILLVIEGLTMQEIAKKLNVDRKTINSYRTRAFEKIELKNDVELTLLAFQQGLIPHLLRNDDI